MRRPKIGITTSFQEGEQRLQRAYVTAVEAAGGLPLIVPMLEEAETAAAFVEMLDALVVTGGPAVEDRLVGALPGDLTRTDPIRTRSDRQMLELFLAARKPVLGICYGMQMLNAALGGALYADVQRDLSGALVHSDGRGGTPHEIELVPGTHLHRLLGAERLTVNSYHVQALASVSEPLRVAARAPDGVIEAVESADGLLLAVQFHPERMGGPMHALFRHLVNQSRAEPLPLEAS